MPLRRARLPLLSGALAALLAGCADKPDTGIEELPFSRSESAVAYVAEIEGAPEERIEELAEESLRIFRREEDGAQSVALLRRRAEQDVEIATKILRAFGWYEARAEVEVIAPSDDELAAYAAAIEERDTAAASGARPEAAPTPPEYRAVLRMIPGPRYTLTAHRLIAVGQGNGAAPDLPAAESFGSPVGGPATAAEILAAESAAVKKLRAEGRPWAARGSRSAIADSETKTIEIESVVVAGPAAVYGPVELVGAPSVSEDFLRSYQEFEPGQPTSPAALREYQQDLAKTDLFNSVSALLPQTPPEDPQYDENGAIIAPVTVTMEESEPRRVSAGLRYSLDSGPEISAGFLHRNIFNAGEKLTIDAVAGETLQEITTELRKPQYLRSGQELAFSARAFHEEDDAYDATGIELGGSLQRELSDELTIGAGGILEYSEVDSGAGPETVRLIGVPLFVSYDGSDDPLDPKEGLRASARVTPFTSFIEEDRAPFLLIEGETTGYLPVFDTGAVLAGRAMAGTILSASLDDVPATRRLYSGGGGSVRGYQADYIGPLDDDDNPTGGRSKLELGAELRAPVYGALWGAVFVEAGAVSQDVSLGFEDGMQTAAGLGFRYASPAGPIRLDVAVPVNGRRVDDPFQIYISIGQAW